MVVTSIVFLSCAFPDNTAKKKKPKKPTEVVVPVNNEQEPDSMIGKFMHDSICSILNNCDYVIVKQIIRKASIDKVKADTSWFNVEDSVAILSKKQTGFLQYTLLSDSTWNWTKIVTKHAWEPELICMFVKGKASVSVLFSPASLEIGFGYTNIFIRKEYKADRLLNNFIDRLRKIKKKEPKKEISK